MIEQEAHVVKINGDQAIVTMQNRSACQGCELSGGCGIGSLGKLLGQRVRAFAITNRHQLKAGDHIVLGVADHFYIYASLLMYLFPLLGLFVFALFAHLLFGATEWVNVLAALLGFVAGLFVASILAKNDYFAGMKPRFLRSVIPLQPEKSVSSSCGAP